MSSEAPVAGAALADRTDGETRRDVTAPSAEIEELNHRLDSLSSDRARKLLLLREKMAGRITLEQVDEIFRARPGLVTA